MSFQKEYSKYYDLLYKDKDYKAETAYACSLMGKYSPEKQESLLDVGCGTGRHLSEFCKKGYIVYGVDRSKEMIAIARLNAPDAKLFVGNSCDFLLNKRVDVVVSLFHVMSYQASNEDMFGSFKNIRRHLNDKGVFVFDFWYGPAVLRDMPEVRIKRFEDEKIKVVRIAKPSINLNKNLVDVNYEITVINKKTEKITLFNECHTMRYFFLPELHFMLESTGFKVNGAFEWMTSREIGESSWYGTIVASV